MQTGATLSLYFDQKVSASYTGYLDSTKKNRLFKNALISIAERIYRADFDVKQWDEITSLTNTNVAVVPSNNVLLTANLQITNVAVASATTFTITTKFPHNLTTGQSVTIVGVAGSLTMNTANGTFTVTVNSSTSFTITVASATGVYTTNTGIVTTPATVSDYWHLLAIRPTFNTPLYGMTVIGASRTTPIRLTVDKRNIIRSGSKIVVSGVLGNTNANGTFYAQVKNDFTIALFSDVNLQVPVASNANYTKGGTVSIVNNNIASPLVSKMKQGVLNIPTPQDPYFEIANNQVKIYPLDQVCSTATLDYIRMPPVVIDVSDAVTDLTLYFPEKLLFTIADEAAILFGISMRDTELIQTSNMEQNKNP